MYDEDPPLEYVRRGPGLGAVMFVAVITSAITSAGVFFALRRYAPAQAGGAQAAETIEVPSVQGMKVEQAREVLDAKGLFLVLETEREDADVPAGSIVSQVPLAGSRARGGSEVRAVVSRGLSRVKVPELAGQALDEATQKLGAARLSSGGQVPQPHPTIAAGKVAGTDPPAGSEVAPGAQVKLLVSSGPEAKEVPKLTGMTIRKAKEALEAAGFQLGTQKTIYDEDRGPWVVLKQEPAAGAKAAPGSKIDLVVNDGE